MLRPILVGLAMLGAGGCSEPPLTEIGTKSGWFVDEGKAPWAHLYRVAGGKRGPVDRQIESYRMFYKICLAYETSRPEGRVIFLAAGDRTPYPVVAGDAVRPWRIDADGLRRSEVTEDTDGRRLLATEFISFSEPCVAAQMAAPLSDDWASTTRIVPGKTRIEETVLEVNSADESGNSTLDNAVRAEQIGVVEELLRVGADVNSSNRSGGTPLMTGVWSRNTEVVRLLLDAGARVNAQSDNGNTALMYAAHMRNLEMAQLLLAAGADVTIRDDLGRNAAGRLPDGGGPDMDKLRALLARATASAAR